MNGFQQSFINHHKSCELFCYFSSYYFPFQQPFHALNVLHPGCVTLKRSKLKKTNQETTSKTNNPPPPMPDKQKKKPTVAPHPERIHLLTTMLSRLCSSFVLWNLDIHSSSNWVWADLFCVPLYSDKIFFLLFLFTFCIPSKSWWEITSACQKKSKTISPPSLSKI